MRRSRLAWSRAHDWKSCNGQKPFEGSNPSFSVEKRRAEARRFFSEIRPAGEITCGGGFALWPVQCALMARGRISYHFSAAAEKYRGLRMQTISHRAQRDTSLLISWAEAFSGAFFAIRYSVFPLIVLPAFKRIVQHPITGIGR